MEIQKLIKFRIITASFLITIYFIYLFFVIVQNYFEYLNSSFEQQSIR